MRIPGLVPNTAAELDWRQHLEILRECEERRERNERRYSPPPTACPWGCDGPGWREVYLDELGHDHLAFAIVFPHGLALFACECNSKLVWVNGRYESRTVKPFQLFGKEEEDGLSQESPRIGKRSRFSGRR